MPLDVLGRTRATLTHTAIIIPQIKLRDSDVELFDNDGLEYIRQDIEGSDIDTRRRITMDFVQGLCTHFEVQITEILKQYVGYLLQEFKKNPKDQWIMKDAAMYIVLALSVKGSTKNKGATKTNAYVNIIEFFGLQVLPELQSADVDATPVLKADCLKFIAIFRNQLPNEAYPVLVPIIARYLNNENFVIHTYAAHALERLLSVKDESGQLRFGKVQLKPLCQNLLVSLFKVLENEESHENEYVMKAIMRICAVSEEDVAGLASVIIEKMTAILAYVSKNPKNPKFNHYLFETICCLIRFVCKVNPSAVDSFEAALFPPFQTMLSMETCQEFGPYCFQILAQPLERRPNISGPYRGVFGACLAPVLWDNNGNVPALVRLLQAYLRKPEGKEVVGASITGLLGVFQKLNASKARDHHGFALLGAVFDCFSPEDLKQYSVEIFKMIFARLQIRKTDKYITCLIVLLSRFFCKHGVAPLIAIMDQIQPGIFMMLLNKIWIPNAGKMTGALNRKICAVGMTIMLCKSPGMLVAPYVSLWPAICESVVNMFELPAKCSEDTPEDLIDLSSSGFSASFAKLVFAPTEEYDPVSTIKSSRLFLATSVNECVQSNPNQFRQLMGQVPSQQQTAVMNYMKGPPESPVKVR
jgi:exportin-2 (importin alpha re-exporter)